MDREADRGGEQKIEGREKVGENGVEEGERERERERERKNVLPSVQNFENSNYTFIKYCEIC